MARGSEEGKFRAAARTAWFFAATSAVLMESDLLLRTGKDIDWFLYQWNKFFGNNDDDTGSGGPGILSSGDHWTTAPLPEGIVSTIHTFSLIVLAATVLAFVLSRRRDQRLNV